MRYGFIAVLLMLSIVRLRSQSVSNFMEEDYDPDEDYCVYDPKRLFFQNRETGAICCRGKILPLPSLIKPNSLSPECKLSTKTLTDGTLNSDSLWCAYTCEAKKKGLIDANGNIKPQEYFNSLSSTLSEKSKTKIKLIMEKHLKCWSGLKNEKSPCHTPLAFHKCWKDAVEFLCTHGMPANDDFTKVPASKFDYGNLTPACYYNKSRSMPGCCHGKPLPWIISSIVYSPGKAENIKTCLTNMGNAKICSTTCFLNSIGVVNGSMELDLKNFETEILKHFSAVKPSLWMNYLGPTFMFYDEFKTDISGGLQESQVMSQRVCEFHRTILELHINKIETYCEMSAEELKQAMKA